MIGPVAEPLCIKHAIYITTQATFNPEHGNSKIEEFAAGTLQLSHPCHNQRVERHVKLMAEPDKSVARFENRDGVIRQRIHSRKIMKRFDTKCQFNC